MVRGTQQPRVTLRISADLYKELVAIAEARDCTLQQALDFYLERVRLKAIDDARQTELKGMPKPKVKRNPKRKSKGETLMPEPIPAIAKAVVGKPKPKKRSQPMRELSDASFVGSPMGLKCSVCGKVFKYQKDAFAHAIAEHPKTS